MSGVLKFRNQLVPRQNGELVRLKVMSGPDVGSVYVLIDSVVTIGRGEDCEVMISDLKASRKHARLEPTPSGWQLTDLGSANGITINGKSVRKGLIHSSESFSVGETTFEFNTADQGTRILVAPASNLSEIQIRNKQIEKQKERVKEIGKIGNGLKAAKKNSASGAKKPSPLLFVALAAAGYFLFFADENSNPIKKIIKKESSHDKDLAAMQAPKPEDPATLRSAEMFFKLGFREFRAKNYIRARVQFETVLQVYPGHPLATLYLENCEIEIKKEVQMHLEKAKKHQNSGKVKTAIWHLGVAIRYLERDPNSPELWQAKEQLEMLKKSLGVALEESLKNREPSSGQNPPSTATDTGNGGAP